MEILDKNGWHPIYIHLHSMVFTDVTLFGGNHQTMLRSRSHGSAAASAKMPSISLVEVFPSWN